MSAGRALVMGLGRFGGGVGAAACLAREGWDVTVTDVADEETLAPSLGALADHAPRLVLGRHDEADFRAADLVVANPAVPWRHELLEIARASGARITSEIELFCERCRGPILGVTGTAGKTTTARLLTALFETAGLPVRLGGNVGISLLDAVGDIHATTPVVLELSSFQLERLAPRRRFAGAAILPITPDHLDRHADLAEYAAAKARLVEDLVPGAHVVVDRACAIAMRWRDEGRFDGLDVHVVGDDDVWRTPEPALLLGRFNRRNLAVAWTLARAFDERVDARAAQRVARTFSPLADRLEPAGCVNGVQWVNDSKATTPETAAAAVAALDTARVHLIAGGHDKGLDAAPMIEAATGCASVTTIGATGPRLAAALRARGVEVDEAGDLETAVARLLDRARPHDVVLLSPGHASFDQYSNYAERGCRFREMVRGAGRADHTDPASHP